MGILILRSSASGGGGSAWEDVSVGYSGMPAELATDGRKVRMDITGTDWGEQVDTVNGASVTRVVGGAYDGTDCIRIVPPSGSTSNPNQTYAAIMRDLDLANGGTKDVSQANLGFCIRYGPRYWDLGHTAKVTGIQSSSTIGGSPPGGDSRAAIFETFKLHQVDPLTDPSNDLRRCFSVTSTTFQSYHSPPSGPSGIDPSGGGQDVDKLLILGDTSNESNDPPLIYTQWMYFEQEVDFRQNRGNANGRNRLDVWTRSGYLGFLEIPLNYNPDWSFTNQYARLIEYIGALWNSPSQAVNADIYLDVSHPIVSVNRAVNSRIEPPTGASPFLT